MLVLVRERNYCRSHHCPEVSMAAWECRPVIMLISTQKVVVVEAHRYRPAVVAIERRARRCEACDSISIYQGIRSGNLPLYKVE
jgi:hypothetical protein